MKKLTKIVMLVLLIVTAMTSCQEENVQPAHKTKSPRDAASGL